MPLCRTRETALRQYDGDGLARDELGFVDRLCRLALDDSGPSRIAIGVGIFEDLFLDQCLEPRRTVECLLQRIAFRAQFFLLATNFHFLELREVAQPQVQDRFGLPVGQAEGLHQHRLRFVFVANDRNDLVDVQVRGKQAIEDVQAIDDDL